MATNTAALKMFAQQTRIKLLSLIKTKMDYILTQDTAELRGFESEINRLKQEIATKGKDLVVEEVAYTWFNRVMALRYMDANEYTTPKVVTPGVGQMRPEILQDAMAGSVDEDLHIQPEELALPEVKLYRRLLVAACNQYGASMPFLFEHISDYTELLLPDDLLSEQSFVSDIRKAMTDEDCQNVEIMGWLYQFYIADRKDDAEKKKSKKGGLKSDEQAAATQLFTPHWVVRYMVENSLGRIWMTLHPESRLVDEMPYYIPTPEGQTDTIPSDIQSVKDIRFLDPCIGSGHIAVYAFDLFCKMYEEEGYQSREIPAEILTNNIYGIDIDRRCYQLACFALTMKARAYHSRYLRRAVQPNVIALQNIDHDTIVSAGNWSSKSAIWNMEHIDTIGSLLQIAPEEYEAIQVETGLFGKDQQVLKEQAKYLSEKYHCVVTNPPYLGKGFGDVLAEFLKKKYPNSKADTMVAFMERLMSLCADKGKMAMINLPSWMFLSTFEKLRKTLLDTCHIDSLLHMGRGIFGIDWGSVAFTYCKGQSAVKGLFFRLHERNFQHIYYQHIGQLFLKVKSNHDFKYDFSTYRDEDVASIEIFDFKYSESGLKLYYETEQSNFEKIPGSPIGYWVSDNLLSALEGTQISSFGISDGQNITGDNNKFLRQIWEVSSSNSGKHKKWVPMAKGGPFRRWYGNIDTVVNWSPEARDEYKNNPVGRIQDEYLWYRTGITWNLICSGNGTGFRLLTDDSLFNKAAPTIIMREENLEDTKYLLAYLNSNLTRTLLKIMNPTFNTNIAEVFKLGVKISQKDYINQISSCCISISKSDWDAHETSWDFKENELIRVNREEADLRDGEYLPLEYVNEYYKSHWEQQFMELHANEEELNRQFIDIYGLQDELTPDIPLNEVTILQKGEIDIVEGEIVWNDAVIMKQLISYLVGCFMGRYSVDKPGLIIASQHQDLDALGLKVEGIENGAEGTLLIDDDGIIPILEGEYFPDDMTVRIEGAIKAIFGEENFHQNLRYLEEKLGKSLREYLFKDFFADHIDGKMYQKRPIYWLFSSKMGDKKKKGYFKALVYMHRIESDTLSKLHADYVAPYIDKIEQQKLEAEDQAMRDDLSQAQRNKAGKLATEYAAQLREVKEFATELAQMSTQRLTIDLDDGVRINYPKYYPLVEPIKGLDKSEE